MITTTEIRKTANMIKDELFWSDKKHMQEVLDKTKEVLKGEL